MSATNAVVTRQSAGSKVQNIIVDLSKIDLTACAASPEEIAQWNPHRGQIVQLDRVIWFNEAVDQGVGIKHVREDEFWVDGHFPERPLMPGVLMVEAGAQLASYLFYRRRRQECIAAFTRIQDTVFRRHVVPGDDLYLLCREVQFRPRRFISDLQGIVDDQIAFESRISGMVLN